MLKSIVKSILPPKLLKAFRPLYHGALAYLGSLYYGRPSDRMIVIGVTGTNGKSTTVNLIAKILEEAGYKAGFTSTVNFKIAGEEQLNNLKMTMPSGWLLQKWMKQMVKAGCQYAVLEVSSEGLAQNRHLGINFDVAVFTNLTPEHIESHGGFENYKLAKAKLFKAISGSSFPISKKGIILDFKKTIIVNADDEYGKFFASFKADRCLSYGAQDQSADFAATDIQYSPQGISFNLKSLIYNLKLKGRFDVYNSLAATAAAQSLGVSLDVCKAALEKVSCVPGRLEVIQELPFAVVVDYAPEPYSLKALYDTVAAWPKNRLIHILGSTGGGRDKARRQVLGHMAGETADIVIVTNEDPYDDDPMQIINDVAAGAVAAGKLPDKDLHKIIDRRAAMVKALSLAANGDLVLVTGKGAEQKMAVAHGRYVDWDDRKVLREELGYKHIMGTKQKN